MKAQGLNEVKGLVKNPSAINMASTSVVNKKLDSAFKESRVLTGEDFLSNPKTWVNITQGWVTEEQAEKAAGNLSDEEAKHVMAMLLKTASQYYDWLSFSEKFHGLQKLYGALIRSNCGYLVTIAKRLKVETRSIAAFNKFIKKY